MTARQLSLFPDAPRRRPRKRPRKMMHLIDAGDDGTGSVCLYRCPHCGRESGWLPATMHKLTGRPLIGLDRRRPCPHCNGREE